MGDDDKNPGFESLYKKEYERNAGRIADVDNLNQAINGITKKFTTGELIDIFNKATIAISKVNTIEEVVEDPLVKPNLIRSKDPRQGWRSPLHLLLSIPLISNRSNRMM